MDLKGLAFDVLLGARASLNRIIDSKWENDPFGKKPHASEAYYREAHAKASAIEFPLVDKIEKEAGYAVDRAWLDDLALHTQIVKKHSELTYPHGRILYALLRKYIEDSKSDYVEVIETGTARGFSALCMAKALDDAGIDGRVFTIDVLSHLKPQIWNCIDDHSGLKSRSQLLQPWRRLLRRITFLQGDTLYLLPRIGVEHVNFAFLDAQHTKAAVLSEFAQISKRQLAGDIIFFDDVTPGKFPGVVAAIDEVESLGTYSINRLSLTSERQYAWARKR